MHRVLEALDRRTSELAKEPFYAHLRDRSIEPRERFSFVPAIAHFVLTFADLYTLVLREEPPRDEYQALVNAHTREDDDHWKWYLTDLAKLGCDPAMTFSDALRFLFGEATRQTRLLSYHMNRMGLGAGSLERLVLVECIEAAGRVSLGASSVAARDLAAQTGQTLVYFGPHHTETEEKHLLWNEGVERKLRSIELPAERAAELCVLVDRSFELFTAFARELLAFGEARRRGSPHVGFPP